MGFLLCSCLQPLSLYLKGLLVDVEIVLCPQSMEEKRVWLESIQQAGYVFMYVHTYVNVYLCVCDMHTCGRYTLSCRWHMHAYCDVVMYMDIMVCMHRLHPSGIDQG